MIFVAIFCVLSLHSSAHSPRRHRRLAVAGAVVVSEPKVFVCSLSLPLFRLPQRLSPPPSPSPRRCRCCGSCRERACGREGVLPSLLFTLLLLPGNARKCEEMRRGGAPPSGFLAFLSRGHGAGTEISSWARRPGDWRRRQGKAGSW
jgi:hypothetical protein